MLNPDFSVSKDIIGLTDMRKNLAQIVEDVETGSHKVIIRKGKPSIVLMSATEFQEMQDRLFAMELEAGLREALEEEKRGELTDLEDIAAELGIDLAQFGVPEKPEGYDQMIPKKYRRAS